MDALIERQPSNAPGQLTRHPDRQTVNQTAHADREKQIERRTSRNTRSSFPSHPAQSDALSCLLQQKLQRSEEEDIAGNYFKPKKRANELLVRFQDDSAVGKYILGVWQLTLIQKHFALSPRLF
ncbi:hypothetical protein E2C01_102098 [Portunus trituberculatus]|uniref:Uncharacterized protein n=1 Tax=Portunus trituberculatus TaxID=210409 RepID=A0A5B7KC96_PORTR|nr:hypothetical protein [Portunus trituberculatus]